MLATVLAVALASGNVHFLEVEVPAYSAVNSSWRLDGSPDPSEVMTLTAVLRLEPVSEVALEKAFWAVSDPSSEKYGDHLTKVELKALLAVPDDRVARVADYFRGAGASSVVVSDFNDVLTVAMSVDKVERALHTTIGAFSHSVRDEIRILRATTGYAVPRSLADDIHMVGELKQFPSVRPRPMRTVGTGDWPNACARQSKCDGLVTPAVLGARYNFDVNDTTPMKGSMAVAEFQGQFFDPADLKAFNEACHTNVNVSKVIGGNTPHGGVEAELDIEYIRAVAPGVPLTVIYADSYSLLNWATSLLAMEDPPLVNSVSYGNDEAQQTSAAWMFSVNAAFQKAGALGLSILFASGDQGVCGREGCGLFDGQPFHPDFPGGSPYHTSVGGTDFYTDSIGEEMAWYRGGGGFSNTFAIPDYQADVVAQFKKDSAAAGTLPPQEKWNNTGRGYPDVSALGGQKHPYCVSTGGSFDGVAGTSASCPVVAGLFARLNGLRLAAGKKPLGFLNPFIYQNPSAFQDVTKGVNNEGRKYGFAAIKGWDAATGLGTPDYAALAKLM